jgi:hypothetical protein
MGPTLISLSLGFKDRSEVPQDMSATRLKAVFVNRTVDIAEGPCVDGSELARRIVTLQIPVGCSHVFGLVFAVHMTAGHNALRGSGPGHKLAFDNALALVGCPDRRIDRLCITSCSPCQPPHTPLSAYLVHAASATGSL